MKMCLRPTWLMSMLLIPMGLMSARQIQHIFITTTDQVNADITDIDSKIIEINVIAVTTSGLRPGPNQDLSLALQRLSLLMGRPACVWMVISKGFHIAVWRNSNRFLKRFQRICPPTFLKKSSLIDPGLAKGSPWILEELALNSQRHSEGVPLDSGGDPMWFQRGFP